MRLVNHNLLSLLCCLVVVSISSKPVSGQISEWLTTPDRTALIAKQSAELHFQPRHGEGDGLTLVVDDHQSMQTIDGFGFALTGGSAQLLMQMNPDVRHKLLQELFETKNPAIGVSYLRISIGSSDMNAHVFTYDDIPRDKTDMELKEFSLGSDLQDVVPVLREILNLAPTVKILATPWSAPSWMKTNEEPKGGSLKPEYYDVYAEYLARYVQEMAKSGIKIDAITPQNEPLNPKNTPSMVMTAEEEDAFIKRSLGPVFRKNKLKTKIIVYDHNCDRPDYPLTILADQDAAQYVDGSGFHLYGGSVTAMTEVHNAFPSKNIYFTEQMVVDDPRNGRELQLARPISEIVIGATRNWSRNVLLWNLAADPSFGPHTNDGGCPVCEGAITVDGNMVTRNLAYYTIAQISKFVKPGAVRIASDSGAGLPANVAFKGADGRITLLVANPSDVTQVFNISFHGRIARVSLTAGAVATFMW